MTRYIPNFKVPNKYGAKKTVVDGITFDSKAEAARYLKLKQMQQAGEIIGFTRQPSFILPGGIRYRPDFLVCDKDMKIWVEDVKGYETKEFKLKKKLWDESFWWLPLRIVKNGKVETIDKRVAAIADLHDHDCSGLLEE